VKDGAVNMETICRFADDLLLAERPGGAKPVCRRREANERDGSVGVA
jgi:hypothetical protein